VGDFMADLDLGAILRAAPIGLLMLFGSYMAARRRKSGHRRATQEFPLLARELGLEFRAPSDPNHIGSLRGRYQDHSVFVDPDDRPRVVVYFDPPPAVVLRTYEHEKRTPNGMVRFETRNAAIDRFFKDSYSSPAGAVRLAADADAFEAALRPFTVTHRGRLAHLVITPERVECALDIVRPAHIPPETLRELLPAAVALARFLEERTVPVAGEAPGAPVEA
jgi:hypothetical protein